MTVKKKKKKKHITFVAHPLYPVMTSRTRRTDPGGALVPRWRLAFDQLSGLGRLSPRTVTDDTGQVGLVSFGQSVSATSSTGARTTDDLPGWELSEGGPAAVGSHWSSGSARLTAGLIAAPRERPDPDPDLGADRACLRLAAERLGRGDERDTAGSRAERMRSSPRHGHQGGTACGEPPARVDRRPACSFERQLQIRS